VSNERLHRIVSDEFAKHNIEEPPDLAEFWILAESLRRRIPEGRRGGSLPRVRVRG
jgi:hypothetical protein